MASETQPIELQEIRREIGRRIRERREAQGLTRRKLVRLIEDISTGRKELTEGTLFRIEKGEVRPRDESLFWIAQVLETDVRTLLGMAPEPQTSRSKRGRRATSGDATGPFYQGLPDLLLPIGRRGFMRQHAPVDALPVGA